MAFIFYSNTMGVTIMGNKWVTKKAYTVLYLYTRDLIRFVNSYHGIPVHQEN